MGIIKCSFKDWCLSNGHQDWLDLWDYELNDRNPSEVGYASILAFWFKCPRGLHASERKHINNLTIKKCNLICRKCGSFGQWMLDNFGSDAFDRYHSDKNTLDWFDIFSKSSTAKIWIKCKNSDHPDYQTSPDKFVAGGRCPVCVNRIVISGVNDVATTHPQFVKYFKDPEDSKKYSVRNGHKAWFKCPICGHERYITVDQAFSNGRYTCGKCGDGISYNNKFIYEFLRQLSKRDRFSFQSEKVFDWSKNLQPICNKRVYDFFVDLDTPIIIEAHGNQHYKRAINGAISCRTLEEEKANDQFKYELAIANGINPENYIVLDCSKSEKQYIISSIMSSQLPRLLNFVEGDIDWVACDEFATNNMIRVVADLWESGMHKLIDLAGETGLALPTISKYLIMSDKLGWIIYESNTNKPVLCPDNGYAFATSTICANLSKDIFGIELTRKDVQSTANAERGSTRGIHFTYIPVAEYRQLKQLHPDRIFE